MPVFNIQVSAQPKPGFKPLSIHPGFGLCQSGPRIPIMVTLAASMAKPLQAKGEAIVAHGGYALIDTGALCSAIDEEKAKELKLPVVDRGKATTASHDSYPCNFYPIQITIGNMLILQVPRAMGAVLKPQGLVALIGRDILQQCVLVYNGTTGALSLSL